MNFYGDGRSSISIFFDGTVENLSKKIDNITNVLGKRNYYSNDINRIRNEILLDFDKYKEYAVLKYDLITLINISAPGDSVYFSMTDYKNIYEVKLYGWIFTKILLYILAFFILFFIFIVCYCYIFDINVYKYVSCLILI